MAISSSGFTLQKLYIAPNDIVSTNQIINYKFISQFKVQGFSQNPNFSNYSLSRGFNFQRNSNDPDVFELKCSGKNYIQPVFEEPRIDHGSGDDGGDGRLGSGGGGGGSDDGGGGVEGGDDYDEKEFGPVVKFDEVMREAEKRGATLPSDIVEAAKTTGIRSLLLSRYLELEVENAVSFLFYDNYFLLIA